MTGDHVDPVPIRDAMRVVRERWHIFAICVVALAGLATALSLSQQKKYTASASLLFRDPRLSETLAGSTITPVFTDPTRQAATNLKLVSLPRIARRTALTLGQGLTEHRVRSEVAISPQGQSDFVTVAATDKSPVLAARIANAFAKEYIAFRQRIDRATVQQALKLVDLRLASLAPDRRSSVQGVALQDRAEQLRVLASLQTGNAELAQPAEPPSSPSSPTPVRNGFIGALLGLVLGTGLAFTRERLDRRLMEPGELQQAFGVPVLGTIPQSKALVAEGPSGHLPLAETEAFRMLHTRLRYFNLDEDVRSVLVTSGSPGDGKTTVAWNLAAAAAAAGSRVLLLEADLRRPALARLLGLRERPGLSEALSGKIEGRDVVQEVVVPRADNGHGPATTLDVVVSGERPDNPVALMESVEMATAIAAYADEYDLTVIDTPPSSVVSDAMPLMSQVSGVIIVSRLGKNTQEAARALQDQLRNLKAPLLGVVANRVSRRVDPYYGYSYDEPRRAGRSEPDRTRA